MRKLSKSNGKSGKRQFCGWSPSRWREPAMRSLCLGEKTLLFYLTTSPYVDSTGCAPIPEYIGAGDLNISIEEFIRYRTGLIEKHQILFDETTDEVYVSGWYRISSNCPDTENHAAGTYYLIPEIQSDMLRDVVEREFGESEKGAECLRRAEAGEPLVQRQSKDGSHLGNTAYLSGRR